MASKFAATYWKTRSNRTLVQHSSKETKDFWDWMLQLLWSWYYRLTNRNITNMHCWEDWDRENKGRQEVAKCKAEETAKKAAEETSKLKNRASHKARTSVPIKHKVEGTSYNLYQEQSSITLVKFQLRQGKNTWLLLLRQYNHKRLLNKLCIK